MSTGKHVRLKRIFREDGRALIVAMDHGAIAGAMEHLKDPARIMAEIAAGGADALLITRGMYENGRESLTRDMGIIMRISGGFTVLTDPAHFEDRIISGVETALKLGADAAAVTIKYGHPHEGEFIQQASRIADICRDWGMPLMVEVMVSGERAVEMGKGKSLAIACRAAFELGADFIKAGYPDTMEGFQLVTEECPVPVVILGGEKKGAPGDLFRMVQDSLSAGGAGIAMGRTIWGAPEAGKMVSFLKSIIHENQGLQIAQNTVS